jgi:hypothetical protein
MATKVPPPSAATFKAQYPEFSTLDDSVCDDFLADAAQDFALEHFPAPEGAIGVMLAAARAIALSPAGRSMQLVSKDGSTPYEARVQALKRRRTMGYRVL